MAVLRTLLGDALREARLAQASTLREVSTAARVSLGYLSEVERGQKEASSELLAAICRALGVRLSDVLRDVSDVLSAVEPLPSRPLLEPVRTARPAVLPPVPAGDVPVGSPAADLPGEDLPVAPEPAVAVVAHDVPRRVVTAVRVPAGRDVVAAA